MTAIDTMGYRVSTTSSEALDAYEQGVSLWLRQRSGAVEALDQAVAVDPQFTLAHCTRAYVAWRAGRVQAALAAQAQAMVCAADAQEAREQLHVQVVDAMQRCDGAATLQHLEQIAEQYPADRMALRLLSLTYIARGEYHCGLTRAQESLAACPDDPQFLTMAAFFLEQSNTDPDTGLQLGLRALDADPGNLYTYHAVGHNYQARGEYPKALAIFERANSLERYAHNLWHLAEVHAILGDTRMTQDYWRSLAPALPLFERIELQWRLERVRHIPVDTSVWRDLADQAEQLLAQADYLTIWMHHWLGLAFARAGELAKAEQQLARLRRLPDGPGSGHWSTLGADCLAGEIALLQGDIATAVQLMTPMVQHIHRMGGGSREQKDIFQDVMLELQRDLGNATAVIDLAQQRLQRNPNHFQALAGLAWAYGQTERPDLQQQILQEIQTRAAQAPLYAQAPALAEAQAALQGTVHA
jgi:tetratricopeptide (TPR) repeat protein